MPHSNVQSAHTVTDTVSSWSLLHWWQLWTEITLKVTYTKCEIFVPIFPVAQPTIQQLSKWHWYFCRALSSHCVWNWT